MNSRARLLILGFALAGLAFAGSSAWVHYQLITQPAYVSPCDINATFNCSQVYLSQYGAVRGVPVAVGGVIWFALVALLAAFARPNEKKSEAIGAYIFALATIGLGVVIYLAYASFFVLKTGCVLCIGTYVAVLGIFIVSSASASMSMIQLPGHLVRDLRTVISQPMTMLVAILFFGGSGLGDCVLPQRRQHQAGTRAAVAGQGQGVRRCLVPAEPAGPRRAGRRRQGADRQVHRLAVPVVQGGALRLQADPGGVREDESRRGQAGDQGLPAEQPVQLRRVDRRCTPPRAKRRPPCGWPAKRARSRSWWTGCSGCRTELQVRRTPDMVKAQVKQLLGVKDFDREYAARLPDIKRDVADGGALTRDVRRRRTSSTAFGRRPRRAGCRRTISRWPSSWNWKKPQVRVPNHDRPSG